MRVSEAEMAGSRRYLLLLGTLSLLVYGGIAWLSQGFMYGQGHAQRPILAFVGLYIAAWLFSMLAFRQVRQSPCQRLEVWLLMAFACLFRLVLLFSQPIQEDDFYRYLWDGEVLANGLNPYRVAPLSVLNFTKGLSPSAELPLRAADEDDLPRLASIPAHDGRFALILSRVNHPAVPTIYPPLAQAVFALSALAAPGSLLALRLIFLGFDLAICGLIVAVLGHLKLNRSLVLVYAWSPLVIKETINSSHYDVVPTFFLMLTLLLYVKKRVLLASFSCALAILGKIYPLLLLPIFVGKMVTTHSRRQALLGLGLVIGVVGLGYAPFVAAGSMLWQGTLAFAERWQTNSLLFPFVQSSIGERWAANSVIALLLAFSVLCLLLRHEVRDDQEFLWINFFALGLLFLCSPAGNPWYFLWLVPFLCIFPLRSWLLLSGLLGLYYLWFYCLYHRTAETFRWILWVEYLPFYALLVWDWLKKRENRQEI